ncbi:hypothetical protein ABPG72_003713 [Tetrahymena utriculariae]
MSYENQLKTFDKNVADIMIQINENELKKISIKCIKYCIQPSNKVVFIDTSLLEKAQIDEKIEQKAICKQPLGNHQFQTKLICLLIIKLQDVNTQNQSMTLITPYNFYRYQIQKHLKLMNVKQQDLQLYTVDKSQGIQKDVIILHIPDKMGNEHLLSNFTRTNVALTRPKMKLIIVRNKDILFQNDIIDFLMTLLSEKNYVYQLNQQELQEIQDDFLKLENNHY